MEFYTVNTSLSNYNKKKQNIQDELLGKKARIPYSSLTPDRPKEEIKNYKSVSPDKNADSPTTGKYTTLDEKKLEEQSSEMKTNLINSIKVY